MNYTVVWIHVAEGRLANIWLQAVDKAFITSAANEIDRLLRLDPWACSEERENGVRILTVPPLGVLFRVSDEDRLVKVL